MIQSISQYKVNIGLITLTGMNNYHAQTMVFVIHVNPGNDLCGFAGDLSFPPGKSRGTYLQGDRKVVREVTIAFIK